jgi:hypothetical protein
LKEQCSRNSTQMLTMLNLSDSSNIRNVQVPCAEVLTRWTCKAFAQTLPTQHFEDECLQPPFRPYSIPPHNYSVPPDRAWRPCVEGMDPADHFAMDQEELLGASLTRHGQAHTYIGGSVAAPTSPNDPIFFLVR